ncbi:MAG: nucleotidyltransferase domain-containing protein [Euryarchaeota archaeon]|nr:nucleotidyltransferase domain-containing protein [Euryarchaeota archaeon]
MTDQIEEITRQIMKTLKPHETKKTSLFGFIVRGKLINNSDIDILVELSGQVALTEIWMKIIEHIQRNGRITTGESTRMFNILRQAALKELSMLALLEVIKPECSGRGACYAVA